MQVDAFGEGEDLVWVMGWGNVADSRHERWLIDQFVDAGYLDSRRESRRSRRA